MVNPCVWRPAQAGGAADAAAELELDYTMTPEELEARMTSLLHTCTYTVRSVRCNRRGCLPSHLALRAQGQRSPHTCLWAS